MSSKKPSDYIIGKSEILPGDYLVSEVSILLPVFKSIVGSHLRDLHGGKHKHILIQITRWIVFLNSLYLVFLELTNIWTLLDNVYFS